MYDFLFESFYPLVSILIVTIAILLVRDRPNKRKPKLTLKKSEWHKYPLIQKTPITHNTNMYRFALPTKHHVLGLPIGQHIIVRAMLDGNMIQRSYTPVSSDENLGFFDLIIKSYPKGNISVFVNQLALGDFLEVSGPKGNFHYVPNMVDHLGMIAGGTGITPMLQIIRSICRNPNDKTKVNLIFANVTEDDILLKDELDQLASQHAQFSVYYVLNQPPSTTGNDRSSTWQGGVGYVNPEMIQTHLPAPGPRMKILICGPPPMVKAMCEATEKVGYAATNPLSRAEDMVFKF